MSTMKRLLQALGFSVTSPELDDWSPVTPVQAALGGAGSLTDTGPAAPAPYHPPGWTPAGNPVEMPPGWNPGTHAPVHPAGWTPGLPLQDLAGPAAPAPFHPAGWVPDGSH
jgi:hypothetical protein